MASIAAQEVDGLEVIIVDDCSTDDSLEVAKRQREEYPNLNIRVIEQPRNLGLSSTRNTGIAAATGDYLTFVDPDDVVAPRAFRRLLRAGERFDADVVVGNIEAFWDDGGTRRRKRYAGLESQGVFFAQVAGPLECIPRVVYAVSAWGKLYRRSLLRRADLNFEPGVRFAEDQPFVISAYVAAQKIAIVTDVVYQYRTDNATSLMAGSFGPERFWRLTKLIQDNLAKLDGWPKYFYSRRVLDYEILQNLRRIGRLPRDAAAEAFHALQTALAAIEPAVAEEFVSERSKFERDYELLKRGAFTVAWIRHRYQHLASRLLAE